ncbi:uncharacterized protein TNCV_2144931 [Trichonephila clavipes]|nr:uncharacterized protein TNCV_2144931 [Trichonephila clavipes]
MIESNIIASGSVNALVEGNPLMALGLKMLHFDHFLKMDNIEYNFLKEQVIDDLFHYQEVIDSHSSMQIELSNNLLSRVLSAYQKFVQETRQAKRLLNIEKNGEDLRKQFITECAEDQDRFDKSIKNQVLNFAGAPKKKKVTLGNKVIKLRMQRDLFGRLLGISMTNKVDVEKVLGFLLTPIPTSMYHTYDGFFMLHIMKEVPQNFDGNSKKFLKMISQFKSSRIDIVFHQYFTPSIKDCERLRRN